MVNTSIYLVLLAACCVYVAMRGGTPELLGGTIIGVASLLTFAALLVNMADLYRSVEMGVFVVDVMALVAFIALALRADRLWPLCVTALHIVGTAGHAVKLVDPQILPYAYAFALRFWGYPMIALLVLGTWNHQRRLARFGVDKSWSSSSGHLEMPPPSGPIG